MKRFEIIANGMSMGTYEARSEDHALNLFAQDAGYQDWTDALQQVPPSRDDEITVVARGEVATETN